MIPKANIKIEPLPYFFDSYYITDEELLKLADMAEKGQEQEALDEFMDAYMMMPAAQYQALISTYLGYADNGPLDANDEKRLLRNIALLSGGLAALLLWNFNKYVANVHAKIVFKAEQLTTAAVKKAILNEVISDYEQLINGAMTQTQSFIMNGIRTLQREMISENLLIKNAKLVGPELDTAITQFKAGLRAKYPDIYAAMEKGNILVTRKFQSDGESVRHYKLDYYADMSTRVTLLNVNRTTVAVMAMAHSERVVGYALLDPRAVKKDREICQEILHKKVLGQSILALDDEAAAALGIMTVDEAQNTPDYAMGIYCRHGLVRCSASYLRQINELIQKAA